MVMAHLHLLLLCTGAPSKYLVEAVTNRGHTYEHYDPRDLYLFVSESENGYDRLYNGSSKLATPTRLKAKDYDGVISRIGAELAHGASILRHVNENLKIFSAQDADGLETASNKLKTTQRLSSAGLKVPRTIYGKQVAHIQFVIDKLNGLPAVAKLLQGSQGKGVMLLETKLATNTTLESLYKLNASMKIQRFIDAKGKDIRAIVVGDKVVVAMERTSNKGDFRANISQKGSGRKIELSEADQQMCIKAAKACDLSFAGVDLMKDEEGTSYIVEVNGNPGTKIIGLTGHNYFVDLVKYVEVSKGEEGEDTSAEVDTVTNTEDSEEAEANAQRVKSITAAHNNCMYVSADDKAFMARQGCSYLIEGQPTAVRYKGGY